MTTEEKIEKIADFICVTITSALELCWLLFLLYWLDRWWPLSRWELNFMIAVAIGFTVRTQLEMDEKRQEKKKQKEQIVADTQNGTHASES